MGTVHPDLHFDAAALAAFCRRWDVVELALFGSAVRDDFGDHSDVDVMVTFGAAVQLTRSLWDLVEMQDELRDIFGREVDLVERRPIRNPFRRATIERDLQVIYAA